MGNIELPQVYFQRTVNECKIRAEKIGGIAGASSRTSLMSLLRWKDF